MNEERKAYQRKYLRSYSGHLRLKYWNLRRKDGVVVLFTIEDFLLWGDGEVYRNAYTLWAKNGYLRKDTPTIFSGDGTWSLASLGWRTFADGARLRVPYRANPLGFQGVQKRGKRFLALGKVDGKTKILGRFNDPKSAHEAWLRRKNLEKKKAALKEA